MRYELSGDFQFDIKEKLKVEFFVCLLSVDSDFRS